MDDENPEDPQLTPDQKILVGNLSETDLKVIDDAILENISSRWKKVSFVIGTTMTNLENRIGGIPDVFYAQRIQYLRSKNLFESQGNLKKMRYSEIRYSDN